MKATKKHISELEQIKTYLERGINFLKKNDIEICTKKLPNALSYYNKESEGLTPIFKHAGSELQLLEHALGKINNTIKKVS